MGASGPLGTAQWCGLGSLGTRGSVLPSGLGGVARLCMASRWRCLALLYIRTPAVTRTVPMADRLVTLLPKTIILSQMDKACFTVLATLQGQEDSHGPAAGRGRAALGHTELGSERSGPPPPLQGHFLSGKCRMEAGNVSSALSSSRLNTRPHWLFFFFFLLKYL